MTAVPPAQDPPAQDPPVQDPNAWLRRLVGYCLRQRRAVVMAYGAALVAAVAAAALPLVLRHVVDRVALPESLVLAPWIALLAGVGAVRFGASYLRRISSGKVSLGVQYDLRNDVLSSLLRLGGRSQDDLHTGEVVSRSISDVTLLQQLLQFLPNMVGNLLLFIVSLVVMAFLSPFLTVVALLVGPALWIIALASRRDLFPANWHAQQEAAAVASGVEAAVTGVRVVKGFGQEQRELEDLEDRARRLFSSRVRVARLTSRYNPALQAVPALGQVGVLALGGWLALRGDITLGTFVAFTAYLGSFVTPVRQVATLLTVWQQARAGVVRVFELIDADPGIVDAADARPVAQGPLALEWRGVTFGHGDKVLLDDFSLRVEPGETVAIVGSAGSGKSTAASLLPRFYDPAAGTVLVGDTDIRHLQLASLRSAIGFVFEESHLLSDTVRANIAYGDPDASFERVQAAARIAQADEFIGRLPRGYDSVIGEQGLTLSGGQRQRIALARAILRDPAVLVLDDATSAIDAQVEAAIHEGLHATLGGATARTTLIIAHRASTLELADRIVVLEHGRIVDSGTAVELEQRNAHFRSLLSSEEQPDEVGLDAKVAAEPHRPRGVTDHLWQPRPDAHPNAEVGARVAAAYATAAATSGPGRAQAPGGGILGSAPPTAEMIAQLEALPLVDADPDIPDEQARAADRDFGLRSLIGPLRRPLVLGLLLVAVDALAQIAVPVLVRHGVDDGVATGSLGALLVIAALAGAVVVGNWGVNVAQVRVTGRTGERLLYTLRVKTYAQLQRLGLDYYERELGGRIMTRMTTDVDALSSFLQTGLVTFVVSILTILGVLVALLVIDAGLAVVLLAVLPILVLSTALFRARSVPAYLDARERVSAVNAYLQENVGLIRVTQAFGREAHNEEQFARLAWAFRDSRLHAQRLMAIFFPFVEFLGTLSTAAVLVIGARQVQAGELSAGTLIAFLLYVELFFAPVQQLSQVFDGYQQAVVGMARLRTLMRTDTGTPQAADALPVGELRGEIEFHDVGFAYSAGDRDVLDGISLRIPAGETVALVGTTGAGKSTVLKLLARFYDPTRGSVRIDGHDLRSLDLAAFRARLGVVPQEAYLFSGTVRDAIAYGRPDATDAEVEAASRAVGAHEMVAGLAHGYCTEVGERGRSLSAGQRQLLALARAELVDPDILLLDEATASLDLATERRVTAATEALTRRRTTLVVAHRLTTAARADRVVVMSNGGVAEVGTHDELLGVDGTYRRLWDAFTSTGNAASIDDLADSTTRS